MSELSLYDRVQSTLRAIHARSDLRPEAAIILGTGLGGVAAEIVPETGKSPILRAPEVGAHSAAVDRAAVQRVPAASGDPPAWGDPEVEVEAVGVEAVAAAGGGK